jgi:hypothetical protein
MTMNVTKRIRWTGNNLIDIVNHVPSESWYVEEGNLLLVNANQPNCYVKPGQLIIMDHKGNIKIEWEQ